MSLQLIRNKVITMIKLEFELDEKVLLEDLEESPKEADTAALVVTYFLMPVRFIIDDKDVFYYKNERSNPGIEVPLMNLAINGLSHIKSLEDEDESFYLIPEAYGDLFFKRIENNKIEIIFSKFDEKFIVDYDELLCAFEDFSERVKVFLRERVPELVDHSYWGKWVRGVSEI